MDGEKIKKENKKSSKRPRCGLCGKTKNIAKIDCCDNWICNDENKYVLFSYARNSCSRNHRRFTLCGYHSGEKHKGSWKDCQECRNSFMTEIVVWYGTNEYNFEKLENPPSYEPTKCSTCKKVISLSEDGYSMLGDQIWCERCGEKQRRERIKSIKSKV